MIARLWRRHRERQRFVRALETMDELPRAVFERARFDDQDYQQIAAELGITIAETEQYLAAAMRHIMASIDGGGR